MNNNLTQCVPLKKLIRKVESIQDVDNRQLLDLLTEISLKSEDIEPFEYYIHPVYESYGRNEIYRSDRMKIFVMSWNPGDFTAIHDHEPAEWGAVQFFGTVTHKLYSFENDLISLQQSDDFHTGMIVGVNGSLIHAMGNHTVNPVLTLHIYGTNRKLGTEKQTRVFELDKERIILTDGSAYLNRSNSDFEVLPNRLLADEATLADYLKIIIPV